MGQTRVVAKLEAILRADLVITINAVDYRIHPIANPGSGIIKAFRLSRPNAEARTVSLARGSLICTCPDFLWRRTGSHELCKHLRACRAVGLL